jgi:2,4-dienoyl-CoA reductase-like NADH-dependent reductase (Old Yellow Enzyme family)
MDKEDIRNVRKWHRQAALRAKRAGFDIVYCYAAHGMTAAIQFLLKRFNDRSDEYGGSLENRVRFLRELIEETKEAVGDKCAVAVRFAVDELLGEEGLTAKRASLTGARHTMWLPCLPSYPTCGTSISAAGATIPPPPALKGKDIRRNTFPSSNG